MTDFTNEELAKKFNTRNVNPELTKEDIIALCNDCLEYGFDGVMLQTSMDHNRKRKAKSDLK